MFALVSLGWMWLRMDAARDRADPAMAEAMRATAAFFGAYLLPRAGMHARRVLAGPQSVMALDAAGF